MAAAADSTENKCYSREDANEKKATMDAYWTPGVNNLGTLGRWAFAELREIYGIQSAFDEMIGRAGATSREVSA